MKTFTLSPVDVSNRVLDAGVGILLTVASLITMVKGVPRRGNSIFTSDGELIVGRIAMLGLLFSSFLAPVIISNWSHEKSFVQ